MAQAKSLYQAQLVQIDELTSSVRNFHFEFPGQDRFDFIPGQFVMAHVPRDGKMLRKPYSIASPPHWPGKIELCIKQVEGGYVSNYFFKMAAGQSMPMEGPLGVFKLKEPLPPHLLFVATGTGVAPLRAMIHSLFQKNHADPVTLILGIRYENEILFDEEFRALAKRHSNFEYIPTISRPQHWTGRSGYVQDLIRERFPDPQGTEIYACGLVPMINSLLENLTSIGYPRQAIHFEKWT
ncbi:MAG TPA: hypothetical protein DF383_05945 [Deltaproteobacteria bacterium]|nr:hypothetical protein [Deltaproteobacteria bacterium]